VSAYIVRDTNEAVDAAHKLGKLDRTRCRRAFEQRFNAQRMSRCIVNCWACLSMTTQRMNSILA
jgi:hypothetical protein